MKQDGYTVFSGSRRNPMTPSHGGLNYKELLKEHIRPQDVKDFSVSINPAPLPESVRRKIMDVPLDRYPDSDSTELRQALSDQWGPAPEEFFVTNGTSQAVFLLSQALLRGNKPWLQAGPTYSEYKDASLLQSHDYQEIRAEEDQDFYFPVDKIIKNIQDRSPALLWMCSPNNPTGALLKEEDFHRIREASIQAGTRFILDEAYRCFTSPKKQYNTFYPGVVNLRSMTKDYSIPGLRLGYFRADRDLIDLVRPYRPEWSVSLPAQRAGCASLKEQAYFEKSWRHTIEMTRKFRSGLRDAGFTCYPTHGNFFLIKVNHLKELKEFLWKDLILVRDCSSFGLKDIIRVGTRSEEDNLLLTRKLKEFRD